MTFQLSNNSPVVRAGLLLFIVTAIEAFIVLGVLGLGYTSLDVYDYWAYERMAINMLDHSTFSAAEQAPFIPTLFRPPGYPAFIAMVYAVLGRSLLAVRIVQFVLHWLMAWLIYILAARFVSRRSALVAALIGATYPPFVFMAPLYAGHTLTLFLTALIILAISYIAKQPSPRLWPCAWVGLALGALALIRPAFQLLFAFAAAVVFFSGTAASLLSRFKMRLLPIAVLALGYGLLVVPWVIRNNVISDYQSGSRIIVGGWALYHSALQYRGEISYRTVKPEWDWLVADFTRRNNEAAATIPPYMSSDGKIVNPYALAQKEILVEQIYIQDAIEKMKGVSIGQFLTSYVERVYWLWGTCDTSPWQVGTFHRYVQLHHGALAVLVLAGIWLCRRAWQQHMFLGLLTVYQMLLHVVFHVEARFTLEARLFLFIYAAVALVTILSYLRKKMFSAKEDVDVVAAKPLIDLPPSNN